MQNNTIRRALIRSLPVMAGYIVLGTGFGILMQKNGYGIVLSAAMSILIYAGSLQYVGVSLLASGASVLTTILTSLIINARHIFYGISMIGQYKNAGRKKPYLIFSLTDETYSILCDGSAEQEEDPDAFRFYLSLFNQSYWVIGTVFGALLGSVIPFSTAGIEFSMTALFIASFTEQWTTSSDHFPALCGLFSTLLCLLVFGSGNFLIPSMILITLILTLYRKKGGKNYE